jgi:coenzyme F420-reducing hydrogenase gamma subunit
MKRKSRVAFFSLTSCEGCQFVLLDLGEKFFDFLRKVELIDFSLIEEEPFPKLKTNLHGRIRSMRKACLRPSDFGNANRHIRKRFSHAIDVSFVEGLPIKKEEIDLLKKSREESKILVAMGNCAALGGIPEMKNYQGKERTIRYIYKRMNHIFNPEIKEIDNFVKVDFVIPGCPINGEEFLKYAKELIEGKIPEIPQKPICSECPHQGKETCFLRKREPCLGPITLAGCGAICPKNGQLCYGCRGILKNVNPKGFLETLKKFKKPEDIEDNLEIFGIKDDIEKFKND